MLFRFWSLFFCFWWVGCNAGIGGRGLQVLMMIASVVAVAVATVSCLGELIWMIQVLEDLTLLLCLVLWLVLLSLLGLMLGFGEGEGGRDGGRGGRGECPVTLSMFAGCC